MLVVEIQCTLDISIKGTMFTNVSLKDAMFTGSWYCIVTTLAKLFPVNNSHLMLMTIVDISKVVQLSCLDK